MAISFFQIPMLFNPHIHKQTMDIKEEISNANMELRVITLELMKIAARKKRSFRQIAEEYILNVILLKEMLEMSRVIEED